MTAALTPDGFAALTGVSRETLARLEAYAELLKRWSGRINLVSRNTLGDLWRRHFLDSAQLLPFIPDKARSLVDLGSGPVAEAYCAAATASQPVCSTFKQFTNIVDPGDSTKTVTHEVEDFDALGDISIRH